MDSQRGTVEHIIKHGFFQTYQALKNKDFWVWEPRKFANCNLNNFSSLKMPKFSGNINNCCTCLIKTEVCHNYWALLHLHWVRKVVIVEGRVSSLWVWLYILHTLLYCKYFYEGALTVHQYPDEKSHLNVWGKKGHCTAYFVPTSCMLHKDPKRICYYTEAGIK